MAHFHDPAEEADYAQMGQLCDHLSIYRATTAEYAQRQGERLDDWCVPGFADLVERLVAVRKPDVVWSVLVYHSRVFLHLNSKFPIRVIDADNVFAGRRSTIEAAGIAYDWFSTTAAQELTALRRAHLVVAIQQKEAAHYKQIDGHLDVTVVPYAPKLNFLPPVPTKSLAFVGANNGENRSGLARFLQDAWPHVRAAHPDASLKVAGSICEVFEEQPRMTLLGVVDNLSSVFADVAIGLNTTPVGTGLKVKSVDTLAHGRPLVSTLAGIQGLEAFADGIRIAEDGREFAATLNALFSSPQKVAEMTDAVRQHATVLFSPSATFEPFESRLREMVADRKSAAV